MRFNREINVYGSRLLSPKGSLRITKLFWTFFILLSVSSVFSQTEAVNIIPAEQPLAVKVPAKKTSLEREFFKNILKDQGAIWTSPFRLRKSDLRWLLPLSATTAGLFLTDRRSAAALDNNAARISVSRHISQGGSFYSTGGAALAFYAVGKLTGNQKARETGLLAGEALIDSGIVVQALKFAAQRPRPLKANGHGTFFTGGNSFPSGHSASIWTVAAVVADEYGKKRPLIKYGVYGLAAAVSLSRFTARQHFLSDILVGSAIGYGIGHFTYLRHHDSNLDSTAQPKKTTKLEKYFPLIQPQYGMRQKMRGVRLSWNF